MSDNTISVWLDMTQETDAAVASSEASAPQKPTGKKQISIEEIAATFQTVAEDIAQISQLNSAENAVVTQFLSSLKTHMEPLTPSIPVSTVIIPIEYGLPQQAHIQPNGRLQLTYSDDRKQLVDLSEPKNRDFMMAVIDDVMPKLEALAREFEERLLRKDIPVEEPHVEIPAPQPPAPIIPEPLPPPVVAVEPAVTLPEPEPAPVEVAPGPQPPPVEVIDPPIERNAKIDAVTTETLDFLGMLGGEVFEQEPVSKYFDDWMVNLRQIILSFESNEAIGADEAFAAQYNQIFGKIQDELDNRIANEAEMAVSARTLVENRYLLNKINEEHAAQTKQLVEKGTSAIETLMRSMASIEKELAEAQAVKVSYRHPLQKMAKDQKVAELTQRLNSVKKRLAMAVGTSSVEGGKSGDIEAQFEAQTKMLEEKRKIAMELLNKNVDDLVNEIAKLKMIKTSNPIKRVSIQQQVFETEQKLFEAKKRLELAEKNSSAEMEQLRAEYEKKKEAALGKVQTLEKDIAIKAVDNSAGVRKEAANALAEAVKALSEKKKAVPASPAAEEAAEVKQ
ncbi:MAG: hypothetical protein M1540_09080 [Candidatus Bathyarchaeota archaeon]|nr:hypothetical protein [Candidatus Bathyarchaeota archaeon]